jgi:protein LTV1
VRYRSQNDPLIHDDAATDFVLTQVEVPNASKPSTSSSSSSPGPGASKIKTAHDLESELGIDASEIRSNEGEAAMYGVYFDDTKYDYMQHLRDMGATSEAVFIEAAQAGSKQRKDRHKGKGKTLDQAILEDSPKSEVVRVPKELLPSEVEVKRTYQDQQDVPDALSGFQPDMDPRLREVLEALEDEAYVDDDEDIFGELATGGETTEAGFYNAQFEDMDEEEDGWASDATEKPAKPVIHSDATPMESDGGKEPSDDWMKEFSKFKKAQKKEKARVADDESSMADTMSFGGTSGMTAGTMSVSGRRRRRREKKSGARTATSGYSMSSSALVRTEGLTLLDDRFSKVCLLCTSIYQSKTN